MLKRSFSQKDKEPSS